MRAKSSSVGFTGTMFSFESAFRAGGGRVSHQIRFLRCSSAETIRFVADPLIFSDVCEIVCDAVYDSLYNDGFLDLPTDWRARLRANG